MELKFPAAHRHRSMHLLRTKGAVVLPIAASSRESGARRLSAQHSGYSAKEIDAASSARAHRSPARADADQGRLRRTHRDARHAISAR